MALTLEDGTGVADAVSFASVTELDTFAAARGLTLPDTQGEKEQLLVKACDYLFSLEDRMKGTRTTTTQRLPFPRTDVVVYGALLASDAIPSRLKEAQMVLAVVAVETELRPDSTGQETKRSKVGSIEEEFFESGDANSQPEFNKALDLMKPLLKSSTISVGRA